MPRPFSGGKNNLFSKWCCVMAKWFPNEEFLSWQAIHEAWGWNMTISRQELKNFTSCGRFLRKPLEDVFPSKLCGKKYDKGQHIAQEMRFYSKRTADERFGVAAVQEVWIQPILIRIQRLKFLGGRSSGNEQTNKQMQMIIWWFGPCNKRAREKLFIGNGVNEKKRENIWLQIKWNVVHKANIIGVYYFTQQRLYLKLH